MPGIPEEGRLGPRGSWVLEQGAWQRSGVCEDALLSFLRCWLRCRGNPPTRTFFRGGAVAVSER